MGLEAVGAGGLNLDLGLGFDLFDLGFSNSDMASAGKSEEGQLKG